jgi:hypothetical protein
MRKLITCAIRRAPPACRAEEHALDPFSISAIDPCLRLGAMGAPWSGWGQARHDPAQHAARNPVHDDDMIAALLPVGRDPALEPRGDGRIVLAIGGRAQQVVGQRDRPVLGLHIIIAAPDPRAHVDLEQVGRAVGGKPVDPQFLGDQRGGLQRATRVGNVQAHAGRGAQLRTQGLPHRDRLFATLPGERGVHGIRLQAAGGVEHRFAVTQMKKRPGATGALMPAPDM